MKYAWVFLLSSLAMAQSHNPSASFETVDDTVITTVAWGNAGGGSTEIELLDHTGRSLWKYGIAMVRQHVMALRPGAFSFVVTSYVASIPGGQTTASDVLEFVVPGDGPQTCEGTITGVAVRHEIFGNELLVMATGVDDLFVRVDDRANSVSNGVARFVLDEGIYVVEVIHDGVVLVSFPVVVVIEDTQPDDYLRAVNPFYSNRDGYQSIVYVQMDKDPRELDAFLTEWGPGGVGGGTTFTRIYIPGSLVGEMYELDMDLDIGPFRGRSGGLLLIASSGGPVKSRVDVSSVVTDVAASISSVHGNTQLETHFDGRGLAYVVWMNPSDFDQDISFSAARDNRTVGIGFQHSNRLTGGYFGPLDESLADSTIFASGSSCYLVQFIGDKIFLPGGNRSSCE